MSEAAQLLESLDEFVKLTPGEWFELAARDATLAHNLACSPYVITDAQRHEQRLAAARLGMFVAWSRAYSMTLEALAPGRVLN